jgi:hypothetical protein
VYLATRDLISNARTVSTSESEEFFNALQFPQSDRTSPKPEYAKQPRSTLTAQRNLLNLRR